MDVKIEEKKTRKRNGEGSVYQLSTGTWVGKLQHGKKKNGKPNRETFSGKTEAEVRKQIKDFIKNNDKSNIQKVGSESLEEYINQWLYNYKIKLLKPASFDRIESTAKSHIIPELGCLQIKNITSGDIQSLIDKMQENKLSHSSIKKVYDVLNGCLKFAVEEGDLLKNPITKTGVIVPSVNNFDKKEIRYFNNEEIEKFKEEALRKYKTGSYAHKFGAIFIFMMNTGIREGEMAGLRHRDINLKDKYMHIKRNAITVKNRGIKDASETSGYITKIQNTTKTYSGDRIIPLNKTALECLEIIKEQYSDKEYLIVTPENKLVPPNSLFRPFASILDGAGINDCGVHTLRHTFASTLFAKGTDIKIISELLGHSNVTITYNIYVHLIKEQKFKAIELNEI